MNWGELFWRDQSKIRQDQRFRCKIRSIGGLKLLDKQFTKVAEKINADEKWQQEAKKNSPMAFADRSARVAAEVASRFNEMDPEELQGSYFVNESEEDTNKGEEKVSSVTARLLPLFQLTVYMLSLNSIDGCQGQT